jgi:hypothetical protein
MNIWPWNKIDALEKKVLGLDCLVSELLREVDLTYAANRTLNDRLKRAKAQIAKGHFRNPETGRIGPKGKTFQ